MRDGDSEPDWLNRQALTSRGIRSSGVAYHEVSATRSYAQVLAHLRQVTEQVRAQGERSA